jgi:hypothetical protein
MNYDQNIQHWLAQLQPISLDEMSGIKLMNRTDTKFVTSKQKLAEMLEMAQGQYYAQQIDGSRIANYRTLYWDTPAHRFFLEHHNGRAPRQKIRVRTYLDSGLTFLEVKTKNNHGRTKKKRMEVTDMNLRDEEKRQFLSEHLRYDAGSLQPALNNHFSRITLVNRAKTERLTIDSSLRFHNLQNDLMLDMGDLVIIELKRDGQVFSPVLEMLHQLHIHPHGFSKYCMGSALTCQHLLPVNRFKTKLIEVRKLVG